MKRMNQKPISAVLIASIVVALFSGCGTTREPSDEPLSQSEFRRLYPRKYLGTLDPSERKEAEYWLMEQEIRNESSRKDKNK